MITLNKLGEYKNYVDNSKNYSPFKILTLVYKLWCKDANLKTVHFVFDPISSRLNYQMR